VHTIDYAGCLECGTCRVVCNDKGIVKWEYPKGTFGVNFRYGTVDFRSKSTDLKLSLGALSLPHVTNHDGGIRKL